MKKRFGPPPKQGLYSPSYERDACGMGLIAHIKGVKSNDIVAQSLKALDCLDHRGGAGSEPNTGDGAGILLQIPDKFESPGGFFLNLYVSSITEIISSYFLFEKRFAIFF